MVTVAKQAGIHRLSINEKLRFGRDRFDPEVVSVKLQEAVQGGDVRAPQLQIAIVVATDQKPVVPILDRSQGVIGLAATYFQTESEIAGAFNNRV